MHRILRSLEIALEPQNCGQYAMKTAIKRENDKFLLMNLKHVSGLTVIGNLSQTTKLWGIACENGHSVRKSRVCGHNSQTCIGFYDRCRSP